VRIEPPLVIEYDEIDAILDRLEDTLKSMTHAPVSGDILQFPAVAPAAAEAETAVSTAASNGHRESRGKGKSHNRGAHTPAKSESRRTARKAGRVLTESVAR
jgi:hypothetical protein